jgi:hypothetical protein
VYFVFLTDLYLQDEGTLDNYTGALRLVLGPAIEDLRHDPFIGRVEDPLRGLFTYAVSLFGGSVNGSPGLRSKDRGTVG